MTSRDYGPGGSDEQGGGDLGRPPRARAVGRARVLRRGSEQPKQPKGRDPMWARLFGIRRGPEQPKQSKGRDPMWARLFVIIGTVVALVSGGAVVVPKLLADYFFHDIQAPETLIPPEYIGTNIDGAINVLLLGTDLRTDSKAQIRTDTIIIAHIPATHDKVYLISLPRDLWVQIPAAPDSGYSGSQPVDKINAAFAYGARDQNRVPLNTPAGWAKGAALTIKTIDNLIPGGLRVNGVAIINFQGFKKVLDAIGGVHMCVDTEVHSVHYDKNDQHRESYLDPNAHPGRALSEGKVYKVGCYNFEPWEALDYARQRYYLADGTGDYGRQRHQQQLLMAIAGKILTKETMSSPSRILALKEAAGDTLTLQLAPSALEDWILTLRNLREDDIVMIKTPPQTSERREIGGLSLSGLAPTPDMKNLLKAIHDDTMLQILSAHPTWLGTTGTSSA